MPAVWTASPLWTDELPFSVERANQLIGQDGNLDYLYRAPQKSVVHLGAAPQTSSTTFVDVNAANYILTITPKNGRVTVLAIGTWVALNGGAPSYMDWIVDSTTRSGDASYGSHGTSWGSAEASQAVWKPFFCLGHFTGLSNAAHTFKLQWRVSDAGAAIAIQNNGYPVLFFGGQD